jgi:hypothetical protein
MTVRSIVASTVFGRWPWWETPVCGPHNEGGERKETSFSSFPLHCLPFNPFQQTSVKWLAPRLQFKHFRDQNACAGCTKLRW